MIEPATVRTHGRTASGGLAALTAGLAPLLAGCGSVIFHDDFDADPLGGDPAEMPAGDPADDRLVYLGESFGIDSVTIAEDARFGSQVLAILHPAGSAPFKLVSCISTEEDPSSTVVVNAVWSGSYEPAGGTAPLEITFRDAKSQALGVLRLDAAKLSHKTSVLGTTFASLGALPAGVPHDFILAANVKEGVLSILAAPSTSSGGGTGSGIATTIPLLTTPADLDLRIVNLQFALIGDTAGPERYLIDQLTLKRDPPASGTP